MPKPKPKPSKNKVAITLSLPREVVARLDALAEQEERSRSKMVEFALRNYAEPARAA